jgi:hypothetical protein
MFRRSLVMFVKPINRTIVRDPRKSKTASNGTPAVESTNKNLINSKNEAENMNPVITQQQQPTLPFAPTEQNQQSVGSMVGSYMLAGFGMGLGMVLVRMILGG